MAPLALSIPGMGNILVNGYAEVRHYIIYDLLRRGIKDHEAMISIILKEADNLGPQLGGKCLWVLGNAFYRSI